MEEDAHGTYCSNSYRLGSCTEWRCLRPSFPVVLHLSPAETKDFMHLRDDVSSAALQVFGRAFPTSFNFRAVRESCLTLEGLDSCQVPPSQKGTCKTGEKAGGKRTTSLFNSCCSNNAKTLHVFVNPFFRCFKEAWMDTGTKHFREISSQSYGIYREF